MLLHYLPFFCFCGMLPAYILKKGEDFDKLPETWVIFITENDVM